jgi:tellurite resistance protein TerC
MTTHSLSAVEPWLWTGFITVVLILLACDLFIFNRKDHVMKFKEAASWSVFWVTLALAFNFWFSQRYGSTLGLQFLTGYIVELSLSVDNLFVMLLIFKSFKVPPQYKHRVLFWGILGAIVFRGIMILVGVDLIHRFHWLLYVFGGILILSAIKFLLESDEQKDVTDSWLNRLLKKYVPYTQTINSHHFIIRDGGVRKATPLLMCLIMIEFTDVVFAVDSVPAVLAVTQDAFVAFASNILALLGLRSLYFVIAEWVEKFKYLKPGLAAVLGFVGAKMVLVDFYKVPTTVSLMVIVMILTTAGLSSWYVNRINERKKLSKP